MNIKWEINDALDILGVVMLAFIAALLVYGTVKLISAFLMKRKAKIGNIEIGGGPKGMKTPCEEYVKEHAEILARLESGQGKLMDLLTKAVERINSTDESQGALIANAAIMNKYVRRELGRAHDETDEINGDLDEADAEIKLAQEIYRKGRRISA